jgi:hypothetical protein
MESLRRAALLLLAGTAAAYGAPPRSIDAAASAGAPDRELPAGIVTGAQRRGLTIAHSDRRLGVPTFLRAALPRPPRTAGPTTPEVAARAHLSEAADLYGVSSADASSAELRHLHRARGSGLQVAQFRQRIAGLEVFRAQTSVVMNAQNQLIAISGALLPGTSLPRGTFALSPSAAVLRALSDLTGRPVAGGAIRALAGEDAAGYARFTASGQDAALAMPEPARARRVWFPLADRLEAAYLVEVSAGEASSDHSDLVAYAVSAADGRILFRKDLVVQDAFTYRVWADATTFTPHDGPHGIASSPHPTGIPDRHYPMPVASSLVTLQSAPFSRNDPWLPAGATQTNGNNVDVYADAAAPDGFQATTDFRSTVTAPGVFDRPFNPDLSPVGSEAQRMGAATNLFYLINYLHDWFYDAGFDEAAGNGQAFNYGRGGLEGDSLRGEVQDFGGRNNANMATPADGARPRMQMYVFDALPDLTVLAPAAAAGRLDNRLAQFGPTTYNLPRVPVKILNPTGTTLGCEPFPPGTFAGHLALIDRGICPFVDKARNAQLAGAVGVIVPNNIPMEMIIMSGEGPDVTIPAVSITREDGQRLKDAAAATVEVRLRRVPDDDRDGALDFTIAAHEWGHYLSNRLIGDALGIGNFQGGGMGEGWSDFVALMLQVRDSDRNVPGNEQFQGVYSVGGYAMAGQELNSFYYGVRRVPYSTDFSRNALTFKHVENGNALPDTHPVLFGRSGVINSEVHNTGEVWATMLWECYVELLNAHPFNEAETRMKQYLVASLKATPVDPTILEARDALLAVAAAADPDDHDLFLDAFARRGAGVGAQAPDRHAQDNIGVIESFETGANMRVLSARLDDSAGGCDQDGILDVGEQGRLTVSVKNVGATPLASFTGQVTAPGFALPSGNALSFPATEPGGTATATLPVGLLAPLSMAAKIDIAFDEPTLPVQARAYRLSPRVNADEVPASAATDTVEGAHSRWIPGALWKLRGEGDARTWHVPDLAQAADLSLTSPWLEVRPTGDFVMTVTYRHSFETGNGGGPFWDGAVIEFTTDGVVWTDLVKLVTDKPGYTGTLEAGGANPLGGREAMAGLSEGFPAFRTITLNAKTALAGQRVQVRFRVGSDEAVGAYGLEIDRVSFQNIAGTPFSSFQDEPASTSACNRPPVAVAINQPAVAELDAQGMRPRITLDGSPSLDPDGDALTYTWRQVSGPAVALTDTAGARPSFVPDVSGDTVFAFELQVSDGKESSFPVITSVRVNDVNRTPVAVIKPVEPGSKGAEIVLDGSDSSDPDGTPVSYLWVQTAGPTAEMSGLTGPVARAIVPELKEGESLTFKLTVTDPKGASSSAQVDLPRVAGCGCSQTSLGPWVLGALAAAALVRRRRRVTVSARR